MSSNDRELLEFAAKAAGYSPWGIDCEGCPIFVIDGHPIGWNPLIDDGDAFRLSVALCLSADQCSYAGVDVHCCHAYTSNGHFASEQYEDHGGDATAASRRAIVRAAAEIGRSMP